MSLQLIQNKKYGDNANPNYEYKADVFSPHIIVIGNSVTQRTDFNYQVFDLSGKLVEKGTARQNIKLTLQKGIYVLVIRYDDVVEKQKLITY